MADLKNRMQREATAALKSGDKVRLATLRLLSASVKNSEVELGHEVTDEEFVEVATKEAKRRREAIEAYERAGRQDRADTEREELGILNEYLPAGLSESEVDALIEEAVTEAGASGPGDMGKVMNRVMAAAKGRADGKAVQEKVRQRLAS